MIRKKEDTVFLSWPEISSGAGIYSHVEICLQASGRLIFIPAWLKLIPLMIDNVFSIEI
jgi:hypothetical protein